ncbi:NfeD family protein [Jatrophihabitans sp. DSM 45814]
MPAWLIWIILAAGLAGAEALSLDLVLVMCAGGASAGAIVAAAGAPPAAQVAAAVAVGLGLLVFVRPVARRHLSGGTTHVSGTAALVGHDAIVLSSVDAHDGRVRLNGAEWSARSFDHVQVIEPGTVVQVMQIDGATAVVWDAKHLR